MKKEDISRALLQIKMVKTEVLGTQKKMEVIGTHTKANMYTNTNSASHNLQKGWKEKHLTRQSVMFCLQGHLTFFRLIMHSIS